MRGRHKPHVFGVCNGCGRRRALRYTGAVSSHQARSKDGTLALGYPCPGVDHMPYRLLVSDDPALRRNRRDPEWMNRMRKPPAPAALGRPVVPVAKPPTQPAMPPSPPPKPVVFRLDPQTMAALGEAMATAAARLAKAYTAAMVTQAEELVKQVNRVADALEEANDETNRMNARR